jgi:antitoxin component of RelBE/YafQ-DinJ toxin-antitoxin module
MLDLAQGYFDAKKTKPVIKIIDGYDIMKKFGLKPSRLVGIILTKIKEEQALGKVTTKQDAYRIAESLVRRQGKRDERIVSECQSVREKPKDVGRLRQQPLGRKDRRARA